MEGKIVSDECYSPYDDSTIFYSGRTGVLSESPNIKDMTEISYSWLVDNILKDREIL
jgi:hypothetical protein